MHVGYQAIGSLTDALSQVLANLYLGGSTMVSLVLSIQSAYTLYLMFYTWDSPEAYRISQAPTRFLRPKKSFTVLLPCRHEEEVIQSTIERVVRARYPLALLEVVVICSPDDTGTIEKAQQKIEQLHQRNVNCVRVIAYRGTANQ